MSQPPEFFQQQSAGAWLGLAAFVTVLCLVYPPMLGLVAGIGMFYAVFYLIYRAIGGK